MEEKVTFKYFYGDEADAYTFYRIREVNATQVAPEDKLTDNVYHYDAEAKVFELGEKFVEREAAKDSVEKSEEKSSVLGDLKAKKEEVAKQPKKDVVDKAVNKNKGGDAI